MTEIELSIKSSYLPEWGVGEGIRELVQNAKDGDTDGYPMKIYHSSANRIRIENSGISLEHKALLFGHTTKTERDDQIGQFGEGLKLGILALVRAGRAVRVFSGNEIWIPKIKRSRSFGEDVLAFEIKPNIGNVNSIIVEVAISIEEWKEVKKQFIFLCDNIREIVVEEHGSVVLNSEFAGKIFVKGIFVTEQKNFKYGYNLYDVKVDRDRKMVRDYDVHRSVFDVWNQAALANNNHYPLYAELIESECEDLKHMEDGYFYLYAPFSEYLAKRFFEIYGEEAIPVLYDSDAKDISHYGARAIVMSNKKLVNAIWKHTGTIIDIKKRLAGEVTETHGFESLESDERRNFVTACLFVENGTKKAHMLREHVQVATFGSDKTMGQFRNGEIYIARRLLKDFDQTLNTLVHEVAHFYGGDGESAHIHAIQTIYSNIIKNLMGQIK